MPERHRDHDLARPARVFSEEGHLREREAVCVESLFQHSQSFSREYPDQEYRSKKTRDQGAKGGPKICSSNVEMMMIFARPIHARECSARPGVVAVSGGQGPAEMRGAG
jgi:hypothetical protein